MRDQDWGLQPQAPVCGKIDRKGRREREQQG